MTLWKKVLLVIMLLMAFCYFFAAPGRGFMVYGVMRLMERANKKGHGALLYPFFAFFIFLTFTSQSCSVIT